MVQIRLAPVGIALTVLLVTPQAVNAQTEVLRTPPVSTGVDVYAASAYVWRGWVPVDRPSLQPSPWVKVGPLTVTSWMNIPTEGATRRSITEHDLSVDYSRAVGGVTVSAGYINYLFPGVEIGHVSHEFYAGVAAGGPLSPSVRVFQDVSAGHGTYVSAGISHGRPVGRATITGAAALGYNRHQWTDRSGWSDLALTVKVTPPSAGRLSLSPFVTYSRSFATALFPSRLYGGVSVSVR